MKNIVLIIIILIAGEVLAAEPQSSDLGFAFGAGLGETLQLSINVVHNNNYFCLRRYSKMYSIFSEEYYTEKAILYGRAKDFETKLRGFFSISTGISHNEYGIYSSFSDSLKETSSFGVPLDINVVKGVTSFLGLGFNVTANFNKEKINTSYFIFLYLGDFVNHAYKP